MHVYNKDILISGTCFSEYIPIYASLKLSSSSLPLLLARNSLYHDVYGTQVLSLTVWPYRHNGLNILSGFFAGLNVSW